MWPLTGYPFPLFSIAGLHDPVDVKDWTSTGLQLADGRVVMPKGMQQLPKESFALKKVIEGGVEVEPDGRVIGRLVVRPNCGNDPVWYRVNRIDVAWLLTYLREGTPTAPLPSYAPLPYSDHVVTDGGMPVVEYVQMKDELDPERRFMYDMWKGQ